MKLKTVRYALSSAAICLLPMLAQAADAGADVNACVYLPTKPLQPLTVNFIAGGATDHCMNHIGNNVSVVASAQGITCGSVGFVQEKNGDNHGKTCFGSKSNWVLSYTIPNTQYSGATNAHFNYDFSHYHVDLSPAKSAQVCANATLCGSTSQKWDSGTKGPLYIIFSPGTAN
ncbi:hypothetical protein GCM10007907_35510 [Chitinimonas prasina]|uniref:Secreted protein n=1 Tax=Chitinimonas prasina TaxID=1434937 RepID=A0ABQ5YN72_9NEIS|nr:hypothetical protein [Chitinimonas prasina]GLR14761.1 hypothetical protein GCM10007907_35510 [Chitinimonas prasina]